MLFILGTLLMWDDYVTNNLSIINFKGKHGRTI